MADEPAANEQPATDDTPAGMRAHFKDKLGEKEAQIADLTAKFAKLERTQAFKDAGLDPSKDARLAYFMEHYTGESDPAKVQEAAIAAGFMQAPQATPDQERSDLASIFDDAGSGGGTRPDPTTETKELIKALDDPKFDDSDELEKFLRAKGVQPVAD